MSSSDSSDNGPTTPPPPPSEKLPGQSFKGHESSNETGLVLSEKISSLGQVEIDNNTLSPTTPPSEEQFPHQLDEGHNSTDETGLEFVDNIPTPDQAEKGSEQPTASDTTDGTEVKPHFQPEDENKANLAFIFTPGEIGDDSPVLLDGPVEAIEEAEKRPSTTGSFGQHESPRPLPVNSSPVTPTSDELPAPLTELMPEQEPPLASTLVSPAISADDSIPSIFKGDLPCLFSADEAGTERVDDDKEKENEYKDKIAGGDEGRDEDTRSNEEDPDDDESIHNPFDFKATPSKSKHSKSSLDSSSVLRDMSANNLWERMKKQGDKSDALDRLMALVGLENVKIQFLKTKATIDAARLREGWLRHQDLNMAFLGNPGTGKLFMIISAPSTLSTT
jgi:hypothetical protein